MQLDTGAAGRRSEGLHKKLTLGDKSLAELVSVLHLAFHSDPLLTVLPPTPHLPQAGSLGCLKEQPTTLYMGSANKYAKLK